jgi:hypothetical protein
MNITEQQIDEVFPPFSDKRRELRKRWNNHNKTSVHVSWDYYLKVNAINELWPLPF